MKKMKQNDEMKKQMEPTIVDRFLESVLKYVEERYGSRTLVDLYLWKTPQRQNAITLTILCNTRNPITIFADNLPEVKLIFDAIDAALSNEGTVDCYDHLERDFAKEIQKICTKDLRTSLNISDDHKRITLKCSLQKGRKILQTTETTFNAFPTLECLIKYVKTFLFNNS
jgi:hypothetical protein